MIETREAVGRSLKGYVVCVASGWGYTPEPFIKQVMEQVMKNDQEGWLLYGPIQVSIAANDDADRYFVVTQTMIQLQSPTRLPDSAFDR